MRIRQKFSHYLIFLYIYHFVAGKLYWDFMQENTNILKLYVPLLL